MSDTPHSPADIICKLTDLQTDAGVGALINGQEVAIFYVDNAVYAIGNHDPFSQANVLAHGIVGSIAETLVVASPIYKQHFNLLTGQCVEDDTVTVPCYALAIQGDNVVLQA